MWRLTPKNAADGDCNQGRRAAIGPMKGYGSIPGGVALPPIISAAMS